MCGHFRFIGNAIYKQIRPRPASTELVHRFTKLKTKGLLMQTGERQSRNDATKKILIHRKIAFSEIQKNTEALTYFTDDLGLKIGAYKSPPSSSSGYYLHLTSKYQRRCLTIDTSLLLKKQQKLMIHQGPPKITRIINHQPQAARSARGNMRMTTMILVYLYTIFRIKIDDIILSSFIHCPQLRHKPVYNRCNKCETSNSPIRLSLCPNTNRLHFRAAPTVVER